MSKSVLLDKVFRNMLVILAISINQSYYFIKPVTPTISVHQYYTE